GVSCSDPIDCRAVGFDYDGSLDQTLNENWDGNTWFVTPTPDPAAADNVLSADSCFDPAHCTAVGDDGNGSGINRTLILSFTPTAPNEPTAVSAVGGDAQATVSFTAPSDNGGSLVTGYTVTATDKTTAVNGGQTATGSSSPIAIGGLTNGDTYTFRVSATNPIGTGPASVASPPVLVQAPPIAFGELTLKNGWTNAPLSTGNAAIASQSGIVYLKGAIATAGTNAVPFTLPAAFRPATAV